MDLLELEKKYLEHCKTRKRRSLGTLKTYRSVFKQAWEFTREMGLNLDSDVLDESWADLFVEWLAVERGLAPATVHKCVAALSGMFRYARKQRWIVSNPFAEIDLPEKRATERIQLGIEQLNALASAADLIGARHRAVMARALVLVQFAIGTRVSELVALDVGDINFEGGVVRIRRGKGAKPREVPLGERAGAAVREWIQVRTGWLSSREGDRRIRGEEPTALWLADRGRRMSVAAVSRLLDELCRYARLDLKVRIHDLRALTAQHWKREGVPIETIQVWLGHTDLSTTKIYTRDACADTRQWAAYCDLPASGDFGNEPPPEPEKSQQMAPDLGTVGTSETEHPLFDVFRELQALLQRYPLLQLVGSGLLPAQLAAGSPGPASLSADSLRLLAGMPSSPDGRGQA